MLTFEQIAEIRARAEGAAPGPWRRCQAHEGKCRCGLVWSIPADFVVACTAMFECGEGPTLEGIIANGDFIAAARTDVVLLCDALEEAMRKMEEVSHEHR